MKVLSVFGTRPEAIKMCPLVKQLERTPSIESVVCVTGQHRQMLDSVLQIFGITPAHDLNLMQPRQTLTMIATGVLQGMERVLLAEKPDIVLVHGDTSTSTLAALAAFYQRIPVGHVEAGLRSGDRWSPFPEEMNRLLTDRIATLYFAPTEANRAALLREGVAGDGIFVTGNTVLDAFATTVRSDYVFKDATLRGVDFVGSRVILMTAHRRENLGAPLEGICRAVRRVVEERPEVRVVYPMHPNPAVRETAVPLLGGHERIALIDPLDVEDMHNAMARAALVLTDSGGLQEEAPSFGVPVVVLRRETERGEAVAAGTAVLAGVEEADVYRVVMGLLCDGEAYARMARAVNPYGDGHASERIAEALVRWGKGRDA